MPEWLNQSQTSYWQQGCDLGKARLAHVAAKRDWRWDKPGFAAGYWFGRELPRADGVPASDGETFRGQPPAASIRMPLTLVDNEDRAGRIPGQPGYAGPGQ